MSQPTGDACVIGGGPAGAAVAIRLARLGYRVYLVEQGIQRAARQEAFAPSIATPLDALGVFLSVEIAGLLRPAETRLLWASDCEEDRRGRAWLVDRGGFDRLLLEAAVAAGAELLSPARARQPAPGGSGWIVPVESANGRVAIRARFLVNAAGRRAARSCAGPSTAVLFCRWRGNPNPGPPQMRVEAARDAWFWGAPFPDGSISILAFLDASRCAGLDSGARGALYRSLLHRSTLLKDWASADMLNEIGVCDATRRMDREPVTSRSINIGDSSFGMDPLSSQGVQAALRSAAQASAVVHTILSGGDADAAIEFYHEAQQTAVVQDRRIATALYRQQLRYDSSFWRERSHSAEAIRGRTENPVALSPDRRLRVSSEARIADFPVIDGTIIRRYPALAHPALDRPVAWLGRVAIGAILTGVVPGETVASLIARWSSEMGERSARQTLSWLLQRGVVIDATN